MAEAHRGKAWNLQLALIIWHIFDIFVCSVVLNLSSLVLIYYLYIFIFLASDNEGQFYFSTTDNPDDKVLICRVRKDHESLPFEFDK